MRTIFFDYLVLVLSCVLVLLLSSTAIVIDSSSITDDLTVKLPRNEMQGNLKKVCYREMYSTYEMKVSN